MSDFPEIKIPFWMNGPHVRTLARGFPGVVRTSGGMGGVSAPAD